MYQDFLDQKLKARNQIEASHGFTTEALVIKF